ncbi:MAG: DNA-binding protein [Desulfurococcales archaeon ex4484_217_2]|nr:MAG: DNA-binding protein [Desulfurococcales archaeon ex4484_217_2]
MILYLFDSSSIVNIVKRGHAKVFINGATLDLARYETLNAIWKEYKLLGRIDEKTALEYASIVSKVLKAMKKYSIENLEHEVFKIASENNITIYDASFIYVASRENLVLVSDDKKLRSKALRFVKTLDSNKLLRSPSH